MRIVYTKIKAFFRSIRNGMAGMFLEVVLSYLFILAGFLVCLVWWSVLIR